MRDTHIVFDVYLRPITDQDMYVIETIAELIPCNMVYEPETNEYDFCCLRQRDFLECVRILSSCVCDFRVETIIKDGKQVDNLESCY